MRIITLATCTLNQWAMDFEGNLSRIIESIRIAKEKGAMYRLGPELEITGYGCQDHFYEPDTFLHSWQMLVKILENPVSENIICDVGMPVMYKNVGFNCRVIFYNRKILLIRAKLYMCNDGNYRESRWFAPWNAVKTVETYDLPEIVTQVTGQKRTLIGDGIIKTLDARFGSEICEELWTSDSPNVQMSLDGVEVITNSSGSLFELRKAHVIVNLIRNVTFKNGGIYMYSNQRGCDGDRLYYNGCSCIAMNGAILVQGSQFSLSEVEVLTATVDLDDISAYRNSLRSRSMKLCTSNPYPRCNPIDEFITYPQKYLVSQTSVPEIPRECPFPIPITTTPLSEWTYWSPAEEIGRAPALWLWDYLRRSGQGGFFLPLSGGLDSASVACIVFYMCQMLTETLNSNANNENNEFGINDVKKCENSEKLSEKNDAKQGFNITTPPETVELVSKDLKRILNVDVLPKPMDPKWLCDQLLTTCYISSANSSRETKTRASDLAFQIGSYHLGGCDNCGFSTTHVIEVSIDMAVKCIVNTFVTVAGISKAPRFRKQSSTPKPFFYVKKTTSPTKNTVNGKKINTTADIGNKENLSVNNDKKSVLTNAKNDESVVIDPREDLALQNVQARMRMVLSYFFAQLMRWARGKSGSLLVLGSSNVDECLRGYMTKYDCSSADINPIGGISKLDLRLFLQHCLERLKLLALTEILKAKPTAELSPLEDGVIVQTDEEDMGMTYEELSLYGKLRKQKFCGPYSMFTKLLQIWSHLYTPSQIAQKVKFFFVYYAINRHKMTVLTPSFYAESYSPDDNRFDQRQFLYNVTWSWQFKCIDRLVESFESQMRLTPKNTQAIAPKTVKKNVHFPSPIEDNGLILSKQYGTEVRRTDYNYDSNFDTYYNDSNINAIHVNNLPTPSQFQTSGYQNHTTNSVKSNNYEQNYITPQNDDAYLKINKNIKVTAKSKSHCRSPACRKTKRKK